MPGTSSTSCCAMRCSLIVLLSLLVRRAIPPRPAGILVGGPPGERAIILDIDDLRPILAAGEMAQRLGFVGIRPYVVPQAAAGIELITGEEDGAVHGLLGRDEPVAFDPLADGQRLDQGPYQRRPV